MTTTATEITIATTTATTTEADPIATAAIPAPPAVLITLDPWATTAFEPTPQPAVARGMPRPIVATPEAIPPPPAPPPPPVELVDQMAVRRLLGATGRELRQRYAVAVMTAAEIPDAAKGEAWRAFEAAIRCSEPCEGEPKAYLAS